MPTDAMVNEYTMLENRMVALIRQQNNCRSFLAYTRLARAITRADARLARLEPLVLPYLPTDAPSASQTF